MNTLIFGLYGLLFSVCTRILGMYTVEALTVGMFTTLLIAAHYYLADFKLERA